MPFENLLNISVKKDCVDYLAALLTPTIAVAGLYIAFNQRRIEEARLRHELFERRYKQFEAVRKFVYSIMSYGDMKPDQELIFLSDITGMRFIFNREIEEYVSNEIWLVANKKHFSIMKFDYMPDGEERLKLLNLTGELSTKLENNFRIFEDKTLEYMQLQQPSVTTDLWRYLKALFEKIKNAAD